MTSRGEITLRNPDGTIAPTYEPEVYELCLELVADGISPTTFDKIQGLPSYRTFRNYVTSTPALTEAYAQALRKMATSLVVGAIEKADEASDKDSSMAARVKAETRLKAAALLDPQRFGRQPTGPGIAISIQTNLGGSAEGHDGAYVIRVGSVQDECSQPLPSLKGLNRKIEY